MVDRSRPRSAVRTAIVWQALGGALDERRAATTRERLAIVDAGGGTGGFAVPLAGMGHDVTVVDPSPDSLAALARRAAEAGVADRVAGVQGDAAALLDVVAASSCDIVLCHSVLEVVDDPLAVLTAIAAALQPGGVTSVLVANRAAAVLHRALLGHFDEARAAVHDPAGRWGAGDPVPRRFDLTELAALLAAAGLAVGPAYGVRIFADLVPGALLDAEPDALDRLLALEAAAAETPPYRDVATQLHVLARASA